MRRRPPKVFRRRGSPFWQYDFQIEGNRFQESLYRLGAECDKATAQAELERIWREEWDRMDRAKRTGRGPMTLGEAIDKWWELKGSRGKEADLGPPDRPGSPLQWLSTQIGRDKPLHRITGHDIDAAIVERCKTRVRRGTDNNGKPIYRKVGPRTVNRTVILLLRRIMLTAARRWAVEIPHMPIWSEYLLQEPPHNPRVITFVEQAKLDQVERPWLRAIHEFADHTGLRLQECLIRWSQIDFERNLITVETKGNYKQEKKVRLIPMEPPLVALLHALEGHDKVWVFTYIAQRTYRNNKSGKDYVRGQRYPVTYWYLQSALDRDWSKAGVKASFHDLRRTAARRVFDGNGGDIRAAQHFLGHNNVKTTERYLGISDEREIRATMAKRDEYVAKMRAEAEAALGSNVKRLPRSSRKNSRNGRVSGI